VRNDVLASSVAHLGVLVFLFAVRMAPTVIVPGPDVIQVALVDPVSGPIIAPPPTPEPLKQEPVSVAPTEETGVKITPPKPPKKPPKPTVPKDEQPATTSAALPYAAVGTTGLKGQISVDSNFEFTYYLLLLRNRVAQNWAPPAGLTSGGTPVRAIVYFRVARDGSVSAIRLENSSGFEYFDQSAIRSIQLGDPMPPLPLGYGGGDLGVHFGFEFVAP
jgi:protein TonB